jgi:phospholipase D1/2
MLKAQHSILMIGWDFDTRIDLDPDDEAEAHPRHLGAFLTWLADSRPDLRINILKWDLGTVKALWRGTCMSASPSSWMAPTRRARRTTTRSS